MHKLATMLFAFNLLFGGAILGFSQSPIQGDEAEAAELEGEMVLENGDVDLAIADFSEAIRLNPKYAAAYNSRGLAFYRKRDLNKAIADTSEAIRLDPKCATTRYHRGWAYFDRREFDKAIADYSEAIRLDSKYRDAYIDRANAYGIVGECAKALADATEAIRLDPKSALAHNSIGVAYDASARMMLRSDPKAADLLFDRLLAYIDGPPRGLDGVQPQLPFDGSVEHFRATARKLDREHKVQLLYDFSAGYFKTAIEIRPDYDFANNNLGVYFARPGRSHNAATAEKYFRAALKASPRYADAWNNLGIVLAEQGKFDEAIAAHKSGLVIRSDRASDHNNLAGTCMRKGDLDNALEEISAALKCDARFLPAWQCRMEIYLKQKNLDEAGKCVQHMIDIDATSRDTMSSELSYATNCLAQKRADDAISLLDQAVKANKTAPQIYIARGEAFSQKGDLPRAKQDFEEALRLRPDFPGLKERLNAIEKQLDELDKTKE